MVCGTRGWLCPGDTRYTDHDKKIYLREVGRLKLSLESAVNSGKYNDNIILMMHFPPTNDKHDKSEFIELIEKYNIKRVIYGHLHGKKKYDNSLIGNENNVEYSLVSADYLGFKPIKIL